MAKIIIFLSFLVGLVLVMNINKFETEKVSNTPFDFQKIEAKNLAKRKEIMELTAPKKKMKKAKVVVATGPLVELSTPQLASGAALYKKCIVCHGKKGQGKKSQKSPAIGGQHDWYLETQINNMRSGARVNKVMNPYIKKLTDKDVKDLSVYISKLPIMGK